MNIQEAKNQQIKRKANVPEHQRTEGKDEAADYILEQIIEENRWPMNLEDIAEETGWSRQHIANTIRDYYQPAHSDEEGGEVEISEGRARVEFDVPPDVDEESYVRGYLSGWSDAKNS